MDKLKGLDPIITKTNERKGYVIKTVICTWCGATDDLPEAETKCQKCGHESLKRLQADMTAKQTENVINTKLKYKCPKCGKEYDKPTLCCDLAESADRMAKKNEEKIPGYYCTGCGTMYDHKVICCEGSKMVQGYIYPNLSYEDYLKMPKVLVPDSNFNVSMQNRNMGDIKLIGV